MSAFEIKMPKLGESITEGTIISWAVKVGDSVKEDGVLFEVNTAKVSAEIPAPVAGKIIQILFKEGDTVPVGTVVAILDTDGEDSGDTANSQSQKSSESAGEIITASPQPVVQNSVPEQSKPAFEKPETGENKSIPSSTIPVAEKEEERWYSPVVLQLAEEARISHEELKQIRGTGYLGRLSKKDINDYIEQKKKANTGQNVSAKITPETGNIPSPVKPQESEPAQKKQVTSSGPAGNETKEMDYVRRIIADHMVMSKKVSAHVTNVIEADVTKLVKWREKNKDAFFSREGINLTYMPVIAEAVAKALAEYPTVNSSVEGYNIILKKQINIGIAVSLDDGNLIVPVVHDANLLNMNGLARNIDGLAKKARNNKLQPSDIEGGTFTITNFGSFRSLFGTPIINQPQVAILGVGYIEKKPAVIETPEGDVIAIRHKMYLSLSFDHRIIDGALGGKFLRSVADYLENWNE